LLDCGLQVHLWVQLALVLHASRNSLNHGLQVHRWLELDLGPQVHFQTRSNTASKCISELHNLGLQMHLPIRSIATSKCISVFNSTSASKCISQLLDLGLQMHLQTRSITASKCISRLLHHGLHIPLATHLITAWKCISELLDLGFQMYLQTHSVMAAKCISEFNSIYVSKCISNLTPSWPQSTTPRSHDYGLQVNLQVLSLSVSRCSCDYALVPSAARLAVYIYIERIRYIIHGILWWRKCCDGNKDESDTSNALWLLNFKNYYCENKALSLPQTCAEVSAAPKFDYPIRPISSHPECTSITVGALSSTWECSCRVCERFA